MNRWTDGEQSSDNKTFWHESVAWKTPRSHCYVEALRWDNAIWLGRRCPLKQPYWATKRSSERHYRCGKFDKTAFTKAAVVANLKSAGRMYNPEVVVQIIEHSGFLVIFLSSLHSVSLFQVPYGCVTYSSYPCYAALGCWLRICDWVMSTPPLITKMWQPNNLYSLLKIKTFYANCWL